MRARASRTQICLAWYHSAKSETLRGSDRQYRIVETAIRDAEWPYDNGDDPSFHVARKSGRLTWGVCRKAFETRSSLNPSTHATSQLVMF
jgi:hypothetical protein